MQSVKIKKEDLLAVIKANRTKHIAEFESASKIFIEDAIEKLTAMLDTARVKGKIIQSLGLIEPQSYTEQYDTAIKMLEMGTDDVIELTHQEFTQYVEDKWSWRNQFVASTAVYNNKISR